MLDLGCGNGAAGIAASRLGAANVILNDVHLSCRVDEWSVESTEKNDNCYVDKDAVRK